MECIWNVDGETSWKKAEELVVSLFVTLLVCWSVRHLRWVKDGIHYIIFRHIQS